MLGRTSVEDSGAAARQSIPQQRQVTSAIMKRWLGHEHASAYPPSERMRDVHMLHHTQSVPVLDERSALRSSLRGNMPPRNDDEGKKKLKA